MPTAAEPDDATLHFIARKRLQIAAGVWIEAGDPYPITEVTHTLLLNHWVEPVNARDRSMPAILALVEEAQAAARAGTVAGPEDEPTEEDEPDEDAETEAEPRRGRARPRRSRKAD